MDNPTANEIPNQLPVSEIKNNIDALTPFLKEVEAHIDQADLERYVELLNSDLELTFLHHDDADGLCAAAGLSMLRNYLKPGMVDKFLALATGMPQGYIERSLQKLGKNPEDTVNLVLLDRNDNDISENIQNKSGWKILCEQDHHAAAEKRSSSDNPALVVPNENFSAKTSTSLLTLLVAQKIGIDDPQILNRLQQLALCSLKGDRAMDLEDYSNLAGSGELTALAQTLNNLSAGPIQEIGAKEHQDEVRKVVTRLADLNQPLDAQIGKAYEARLQETAGEYWQVIEESIRKFSREPEENKQPVVVSNEQGLTAMAQEIQINGKGVMSVGLFIDSAYGGPQLAALESLFKGPGRGIDAALGNVPEIKLREDGLIMSVSYPDVEAPGTIMTDFRVAGTDGCSSVKEVVQTLQNPGGHFTRGGGYEVFQGNYEQAMPQVLETTNALATRLTTPPTSQEKT